MLVDKPASKLLQSGNSNVLSHDWSGFGRVVTGNEIIAVSSMERDKIMAKEVSVAAANQTRKQRTDIHILTHCRTIWLHL